MFENATKYLINVCLNRKLSGNNLLIVLLNEICKYYNFIKNNRKIFNTNSKGFGRNSFFTNGNFEKYEKQLLFLDYSSIMQLILKFSIDKGREMIQKTTITNIYFYRGFPKAKNPLKSECFLILFCLGSCQREKEFENVRVLLCQVSLINFNNLSSSITNKSTLLKLLSN